MPFDINPVTAKYQTGDKPATEGKYGRHLFIYLFGLSYDLFRLTALF